MPTCTRKSPVIRGFVALAMLAASCASAEAAQTPPPSTARAFCEADYGGRTEKLDLQPTDDVYATRSVTLGERFRFHAQYLSARAKLKTWVYELRERGPALLHAAEYPMPVNACSLASAAGTGSTDFGLNKVYSSDLERELFFRCVRSCD